MTTAGFLDALIKDVAYGWRVLLKSPAYTLIGVLSLALGIGANTAIFSVVRAVLLRPLPYPAPEQLMLVMQHYGGEAVTMAEFEFWRDNTAVFASAAGDRADNERSIAIGARQESIDVKTVTSDFFRTLGVGLALGREFTAAEMRPNSQRVIVLSNEFWQRAFGADTTVVGRTITLDNVAFTVVGVTPRAFWYPRSADAYVALRVTGSPDDAGTNTRMLARLKPGVSLAQASAAMQSVSESFRTSGKGPRKHQGLTLVPYQQWLVGDVRLTLLLLFGAVAALLLIACLNLASLLLARVAARQKEIAVRLALGGRAGRLWRQFLAENALLTIAGSVAGLIGAGWLLRGITSLVPFQLPSSEPIRLDGTVLAFTLAIASATALGFSLAPFFAARRLAVYETLKSGGRATGGGGRIGARSVLVVSEVALSVTLLVSAALLIQSLYRLHAERLGFAPQNVITFATPAERYRNPAAQDSFNTELLQRLQAIPGVRAAAAASMLPLMGHSNYPTQREGHPEQSIGGMEIRSVTPGYFVALRIPIARGRAFTDNDSASAPAVILVNETLARKWWRDADPTQGRIEIGKFQGRTFLGAGEPTRQVVGVVADTKTELLKEPPLPTVYIPAAQAGQFGGGMSWVVRADSTAGLGERLRRAVADIDPQQRIRRMQEMQEIVSATTATSRFDAGLFGIFAGLALTLTAIGIYGLLAFSVARRTNEFGIRMALGASRLDVLAQVLRQGAALIGIGLAAGVAGALALTRSLGSLLYGVKPGDPWSFAAVAAILLAVGLAASYLPARRATRVDPMIALRYE